MYPLRYFLQWAIDRKFLSLFGFLSENDKNSIKRSVGIGDGQIHVLIVQCSKLITTFWRRRPDFFVHLGPLSQSDWVGGQQQWQQGRPHQVYQEHVQKCTWHRKKVVSIMVESVRPFSEPQEGGHQEWQADRPLQVCQEYVVKLRVLSHSLITPG